MKETRQLCPTCPIRNGEGRNGAAVVCHLDNPNNLIEQDRTVQIGNHPQEQIAIFSIKSGVLCSGVIRRYAVPLI